MYEGKCNHCGSWQKFLRPNGPAVQTLEWGDGPITRGPAEHAP
jgi:hypothetical protein